MSPELVCAAFQPPNLIAESIMRCLGRGIEAELGDIHRYVSNDYGRVTTRTINRYLAMLICGGLVTRCGVRGHYTYQRATKSLSS